MSMDDHIITITQLLNKYHLFSLVLFFPYDLSVDKFFIGPNFRSPKIDKGPRLPLSA